MEDVAPIVRRNSIAGPFMRSSAGISADHRPSDDDFEPEVKASTLPTSSPMNIPPPLTRSNTTSGWFGGWFSRGRTSITSPPTTDPSPLSFFKRGNGAGSTSDSVVASHADDNYTNLAASAPQIAPPHSNSRDYLFNSTGSMKPAALNAASESASSAQANVPPLSRRRSETGIIKSSSASSKKEATPSSSPVASDMDVRPGPIETDLFWMVLRDIGE